MAPPVGVMIVNPSADADTPTSLLESSVVQWHWLQELAPEDGGDLTIDERQQVASVGVPFNVVLHFTPGGEQQ